MAIRATQIQVEAVVQEMGEPMHQLDLAMDTKRPHWVWVSDILALYNSVVGVSNGLYKIVTERADLPGGTRPFNRPGGAPLSPARSEIIAIFEKRFMENHG